MREDIDTLKNDWLTDNVCPTLDAVESLWLSKASVHIILGGVSAAKPAYAMRHPALRNSLCRNSC